MGKQFTAHVPMVNFIKILYLHHLKIYKDSTFCNVWNYYIYALFKEISQFKTGKREPGPGGINKLPRNFLTDGTSANQLLKSSNDILFSAPPSTFFENFAESRNI